jgi:uncharacterized protein YabN with tetrapyrrole methylase and pyrophosphatase domain
MMKGFLKFFAIVVLISMLWICGCILKNVIEYQDIQDAEVETVKSEITKLKEQIDNLALKEDLFREAADISIRIEDLQERLIPVEEDQRFYKDVWREYFKMKEVPP